MARSIADCIADVVVGCADVCGVSPVNLTLPL